MSNLGGNVARKFRNVFRVPQKDTLQWFPGHMNKGLKQMQGQLKMIDCVIEVHDARIPISGRNPNFRNTVSGLKPHIFVLNKDDLADRSYDASARKILEQEGISHVFFTQLKNQHCPEMEKILPLAINLITNSNRYNRSLEEDLSLMVIGVPNVGKSSLINRLRNRHLGKGNATPVGAMAGITRAVLTKIKINERPPVFLLDTPGVLTPNVSNLEVGLKLALVSCLQDHLVGEDIIADYLLYWLNKQKRFDYVEKMGLTEPCDDIIEVLTRCAIKLGKTRKSRQYDGQIMIRPDILVAAQYFIKLFRTGELGRVCLDADILKVSETQD